VSSVANLPYTSTADHAGSRYPTSPPNTELSCEAPSWLGFVSFNSLFDGVVTLALLCPREPRSLSDRVSPMVAPRRGSRNEDRRRDSSRVTSRTN
jgi:hypothetical protein